jgi:hypothetical protein
MYFHGSLRRVNGECNDDQHLVPYDSSQINQYYFKASNFALGKDWCGGLPKKYTGISILKNKRVDLTC